MDSGGSARCCRRQCRCPSPPRRRTGLAGGSGGTISSSAGPISATVKSSSCPRRRRSTGRRWPPALRSRPFGQSCATPSPMRITAFSASIPSPGKSPCPGKRSSPAGETPGTCLPATPSPSGTFSPAGAVGGSCWSWPPARSSVRSKRARPDTAPTGADSSRRRFNPQNYYLTEEGLAFFYPMYAIAPAVEGAPHLPAAYGESLPSPRRDEGA